MKHKLLTLISIFFFLSGIFLFADTKESPLFVKTMFVVKVYNTDFGFRVDYQTSDMKLHSLYMPEKWFEKTAGYGEVIYGDNSAMPYMSIWYKNDKVDHFRLYVKENYSDPSWGTLARDQVNPDDFKIDTLKVVY